MYYKVSTKFNQPKNFFGMEVKGDVAVFDDVKELSAFINGDRAYDCMDCCVYLKDNETIDTLYIAKDYWSAFHA